MILGIAIRIFEVRILPIVILAAIVIVILPIVVLIMAIVMVAKNYSKVISAVLGKLGPLFKQFVLYLRKYLLLLMILKCIVIMASSPP